MGAVLVVMVPPLAAVAACATAAFRDRRGTCHPRGRWPLHHPAANDTTSLERRTVIG